MNRKNRYMWSVNRDLSVPQSLSGRLFSRIYVVLPMTRAGRTISNGATMWIQHSTLHLSNDKESGETTLIHIFVHNNRYSILLVRYCRSAGRCSLSCGFTSRELIDSDFVRGTIMRLNPLSSLKIKKRFKGSCSASRVEMNAWCLATSIFLGLAPWNLLWYSTTW